MSTKLNAMKLAKKRYPDDLTPDCLGYGSGVYATNERLIGRDGYAAAIREHSQPLADEAAEYRKALEEVVRVYDEGDNGRTMRWTVDEVRDILAKYPKP